MNERIQELHEQAMKSCDEHRSDILNYHHIYREKFAELLLKDVAQFGEDKFDFCGDEIIIAEKIREQYGVEE